MALSTVAIFNLSTLPHPVLGVVTYPFPQGHAVTSEEQWPYWSPHQAFQTGTCNILLLLALKCGKKHETGHSMPAGFLWANTLQEPTSSTFKFFPSKTSLTSVFLTFFIQTDIYTPQFLHFFHCPAPFWHGKLTCRCDRCLAPQAVQAAIMGSFT